MYWWEGSDDEHSRIEDTNTKGKMTIYFDATIMNTYSCDNRSKSTE